MSRYNLSTVPIFSFFFFTFFRLGDGSENRLGYTGSEAWEWQKAVILAEWLSYLSIFVFLRQGVSLCCLLSLK
jgi:hypothetical protein